MSHFLPKLQFLAEMGWFGRNWPVLQMVLFGKKYQIFDPTISAEPLAEISAEYSTETIFSRTLPMFPILKSCPQCRKQNLTVLVL